MSKGIKYYVIIILEIILLLVITSILCFKFKIAYNEMDIFPYARATFANGFSSKYFLNFDFPSNFLFNFILGFFISKYDAFSVIIFGRLLSYAMICSSYLYLSKVLKMKFFVSAMTYILFLYFFKNGIGDAGEWIVGGLESKVIAYSFCIFSLALFLKEKYKKGFLFAGIGLSTHLLVGTYHLICLTPLILSKLNKKNMSFKTLIFGMFLFSCTAIVGISEIFNSLFSSIPEITQKKGWDIYVNIRVPHHVIPDFSVQTWLKLSLLTLISILFIKSKSQSKKHIAQYALSSVIIIIIGLAIYNLCESHYMRYYFFRFSDVMLPLIVLLLLGSCNNLMKNVYKFLALIVFTVVAQKNLSEFSKKESYDIKFIKQNTNLSHHKQEGSLDQKISNWIIKNTHKKDQFIVPPDNLYFCMKTEREIFISWWMLPNQLEYKSVKNIPADMILWYNRLKKLNLNMDFKSLNEIKSNYYKLSKNSIKEIQLQNKSIKYILMPSTTNLEFPIAIETEKQKLYRIL